MQVLQYIKNNIQLSINILIGCIIITIFVLAIAMRQGSSQEQENFEQNIKVEMEAHTNKLTIPVYSFTKKNATIHDNLTEKMVNFSCIIDGKKYYLANTMALDCKNKTTHVPDCEASMLVLIDESIIESGLEEYTKSLSTNETICVKNPKIIKKSVCRQNRLYIHDFKLTNVGTTTSDTRYTIRGTAVPLLNGHHAPTLINQNVGQTHDSELVCSGDYGYGMHKDENIYGEIYIVPNGTSTDLDNCMLKMTSYVVLKGVTGKPAVRIMEKGAPKTVSTYFAVDKTTKCNNYNRVKLVSDANNKDVIHFNVQIVS